jgi:uncharacterized protein with GYD domain
MALYMYKFTYTPETWKKKLEKKPEDRRIAINRMMDQIGGKLINLFYAFDEFDGLVVFEAPDDVSAQAAMLKIFSHGNIKAIRPARLYTVEQMMAGMRQAKGLEFRSVPFASPEVLI